MPANADTPCSVPCGPFTISMRSMSSTAICASDGLNGPPTGTPSTVTSSASNSFNPHMPMFGSRPPLSLPPPVSRPTTSIRASESVRAPLRRSSRPLTAAVPLGTSRGLREVLVAETTMP